MLLLLLFYSAPLPLSHCLPPPPRHPVDQDTLDPLLAIGVSSTRLESIFSTGLTPGHSPVTAALQVRTMTGRRSQRS